jgi:heptaprenyl diphosphate synthase
VLFALRSTSPDEGRLRQLLTECDLTDEDLHAEALALLRQSPALEEARSSVREWISGARDLVGRLPDLPARAAFEALCDFVTTRAA